MKTMLLSFALSSALFAQTATTAPSGSDNKTPAEKQTQPATSDVKDAGSDTKDVGTAIGHAGKAVGRATVKGTKTGYRHTKRAIKKGADKTSDALTDKDQKQTTTPPADTTPPPPADTTQPK